MYSTKELFPKKAHSYITIGDPYQKKSAGVDPRRQGKQFVNNPARAGVHFGTHKYMPTKYQQSNPYFVQQPPEKRKLGLRLPRLRCRARSNPALLREATSCS